MCMQIQYSHNADLMNGNDNYSSFVRLVCHVQFDLHKEISCKWDTIGSSNIIMIQMPAYRLEKLVCVWRVGIAKCTIRKFI